MAPIPFKRYQNKSGCGTAFKEIVLRKSKLSHMILFPKVKIMKNAFLFHFIIKALFALKIFKFVLTLERLGKLQNCQPLKLVKINNDKKHIDQCLTK